MLSNPKRLAVEDLPQSPSTLPSPTMSPVGVESGVHLALTTIPKVDLDYSLENLPEIISYFDTLPDSLKSFVLVQLLKRSPLPTLQLVSSLILPSLKQDFVNILPVELCHHIFRYLDVKTLSKCQRVHSTWKHVLEGASTDQSIWKMRLINEGFSTENELKTKVDPDHPKDQCADQTELMNKDQEIIKNQEPVFSTYKAYYKKCFMIRKNWLSGRYRQISFPGHGPNVVTCLQFDTEKIVSGSDDHTIHIYNTSQGELDKKLTGHDGGVWALQYWQNTLVSGSTDRTVRVWDMESGECTHVFDGHTSTVRCLLILTPAEISPGGPLFPEKPLIITGSRDATLRVWELPDIKSDAPWNPALATRTEGLTDPIASERTRNPFFKYLFTGHTNSVRAIAGHANILISGSYDCTVRAWDLETGQNIHTFRGHREKVYSVGYCHELGRCVSGSMDSTVRVWCTKTGVQLFNLEGHTSLVGLLELSSKYLVSAAADASLRIWCPMTGKCLASLVGHSAAITCFHHDPVYNRIVSGSDGGVKIWELDSFGYGTSNLVSPSIIPSTSPLHGKLAYAQTPEGLQPLYGRFITDVLSQVQGVWRVRMDENRLVCACQREQGGTWFEVLDFSESPLIGTHSTMPGDRSVNPDGEFLEEMVEDDDDEE